MPMQECITISSNTERKYEHPSDFSISIKPQLAILESIPSWHESQIETKNRVLVDNTALKECLPSHLVLLRYTAMYYSTSMLQYITVVRTIASEICNDMYSICHCISTLLLCCTDVHSMSITAQCISNSVALMSIPCPSLLNESLTLLH